MKGYAHNPSTQESACELDFAFSCSSYVLLKSLSVVFQNIYFLGDVDALTRLRTRDALCRDGCRKCVIALFIESLPGTVFVNLDVHLA